MRLALILLSALLACPGSAQEIRVSATGSPLENVFRRVEPALAEREGIRLVLRETDPVSALHDLVDGRAEIAAAAMDLPLWLEACARANRPIADPLRLRAVSLGRDALTILLHPDVLILDLDPTDLEGLFSGRILRWSALDGPDLPIRLAAAPTIPELQAALEAHLPKESLRRTPDLRAANLVELRALVARTPGAFALAPKGSNGPEVLSPLTPDWTVPLTLVTLEDPKGPARTLVRFLRSRHARKLVMN